MVRFQQGSMMAVWQEISDLSNYFLSGQAISLVTSRKDLSVLIDSTLMFHLHTRSIVNSASGLFTNFLKCTTCRFPEFTLILYKVHIRTLLEFPSCLWNRICYLKILESVQRTWTHHIDDMAEFYMLYVLRCLGCILFRVDCYMLIWFKCWRIFHDNCSIKQRRELFFLWPQFWGLVAISLKSVILLAL